jgi:hypothetical protein
MNVRVRSAAQILVFNGLLALTTMSARAEIVVSSTSGLISGFYDTGFPSVPTTLKGSLPLILPLTNLDDGAGRAMGTFQASSTYTSTPSLAGATPSFTVTENTSAPDATGDQFTVRSEGKVNFDLSKVYYLDKYYNSAFFTFNGHVSPQDTVRIAVSAGYTIFDGFGDEPYSILNPQVVDYKPGDFSTTFYVPPTLTKTSYASGLAPASIGYDIYVYINRIGTQPPSPGDTSYVSVDPGVSTSTSPFVVPEPTTLLMGVVGMLLALGYGIRSHLHGISERRVRPRPIPLGAGGHVRSAGRTEPIERLRTSSA